MSVELLVDNLKWIFSGVGVVIVVFLINYFRNRRKTPEVSPMPISSTEPQSVLKVESLNMLDGSDGSNSRVKESTRILFIDDKHRDFNMVSILKKGGWTNTKAVKDIVDLDDHKVVESDIIFVDINGVGTTMFEDQGLGLASALKKRHPQIKIVLYSAETTGDRFHRAIQEVDDCLSKDAEPYQFISLIEELIAR